MDHKKILHMLATYVKDQFSLKIYQEVYDVSDKQLREYKRKLEFEKSQGIERDANGEFI